MPTPLQTHLEEVHAIGTAGFDEADRIHIHESDHNISLEQGFDRGVTPHDISEV